MPGLCWVYSIINVQKVSCRCSHLYANCYVLLPVIRGSNTRDSSLHVTFRYAMRTVVINGFTPYEFKFLIVIFTISIQHLLKLAILDILKMRIFFQIPIFNFLMKTAASLFLLIDNLILIKCVETVSRFQISS